MKNKLKINAIGAITIGSITTFINTGEKNIKDNSNFFLKIMNNRKNNNEIEKCILTMHL